MPCSTNEAFLEKHKNCYLDRKNPFAVSPNGHWKAADEGGPSKAVTARISMSKT
jgi:hypothetical protein